MIISAADPSLILEAFAAVIVPFFSKAGRKEGIFSNSTLPGSSSSDIFAVGDNATILHYDGKSWSPMDSGTEKYLTKVRGLGSDRVYAVGDDGLVIRYDGEKWTDMSLGGNG